MQIFAKPTLQGSMTLDMEPSDSMEAIKAKIQDKNGFDPADQYLFYAGNCLQDGYTLSDYNIQNE